MIVLISDVILHYIVFPDENWNNDTDLTEHECETEESLFNNDCI